MTGKSNQNESHWQIQTKRKSLANPNKTKVHGKSKQNESPWLVNPKRKSLGNQTMCKSNFLRIEYACIKYRKKADNACWEGIFFSFKEKWWTR